MSPPYVFPDRKPTFYDSDRRNDVWAVSGPTYTDGTGWNWEKRDVDLLVAGDIWVPIHTLHSEPIAAIAERARELSPAPKSTPG